MITDAFMFFNELELLEIRLHELSSVVDRFVLVEARETFSFRPKPLHYFDNRERFKRFWDRIDHRVIERFPIRNDPWEAERTQREWALQAFGGGGGGGGEGDPDDIFICSDVDEIPRASAITPDIAREGPVLLEQPQYYLYLNCLNLDDPPLKKALVVRRRDLKHSLTEFRTHKLPSIPNGGWHFSYLGGLPRIQTKMAAYSHQELNIGHYTSQKNYERALRAGRLHYNAKYRIREVPLDDSFPKHVLEQSERFAHLIAPPGLVASSLKDLAILRLNHSVVQFRERVRRRLRREIKQRFG
jgi:beta-1,4-mannosyl-glycoprotein beta-1,4-N-acetylglucosaminyltransferase